LIDARSQWVPLPEILALGVAQYNARIFELRRLDFRIENRAERRDGQTHTFFRLVPSPNAGHSAALTKLGSHAENKEEKILVKRSAPPPPSSCQPTLFDFALEHSDELAG
jgi:hypothetical protein